ncbi:MAG TPA: lipoprotein signal peptidase [Campylobacteraceae bacterium]|jgi:signal peptidase II|nr:lipoprotein signal peptidase [Campylobacteraceae bacterium]HHD83543.1 lipoprotein signal peptidase [Campylobacteraceae bacterium]
MDRFYIRFLGTFVAVFVVDQIIKSFFLNGFDWNSNCISLNFTLNKGVAFSMFAFLGESLKYIQVVLIGGVLGYILWHREKFQMYAPAIGLLMGGGVSNLLDRFLHGGVVDYVYWHCGFDFAIFNFADVMIDLGVLWILIISFRKEREKSPLNN